MPSAPPGPNTQNTEVVIHRAPGSPDEIYGVRDYLSRRGDRLVEFSFDFSPALASQLFELYCGDADPETVREVGKKIRGLLADAGVAVDTVDGYVTICSDAPELYALPFELSARNSAWLGLTSGVSLRYRWPNVISEPEGNDCGRIALAWAAPSRGVSYAQHIRALSEHHPEWLSFDARRDVVADASCNAIVRHLETTSDTRVLYILCHGESFGSQFGLALEQGKTTVPTQIATALEPFRKQLRLIVLCACHGGENNPATSELGSVARELHRIGFPYILASRMPLHVNDSVVITKTICKTLDKHFDSVDLAVYESRRTLHNIGTAYGWVSLQLFVAPHRDHAVSESQLRRDNSATNSGTNINIEGPQDSATQTIILHQGPSNEVRPISKWLRFWRDLWRKFFS